MNHVSRLIALVLTLLVASVAFAQTTSTLVGTVTTDGSPLPGATVTITSPNMQGSRTTVTGDAGGYSFTGLPPGTYTVRFELQGMRTATRTTQIGVGQTGRADATLTVEAMAESITVTAAAASVLETPTVSQNLDAELVDELPIQRTVLAAAALAPGVNTSTLSNGQLSISGSPGYDNKIMVNGVAITESVRSQAQSLFIEDAIQETTVMTAGISAEYGGFTGGVVNSITKSGGNQFSGSLRDSFTNPTWTAENPLQRAANAQNIDVLNQVWEATFGGFILRDRLWFFAAGRDSSQSSDVATRIVPGDTTKTSLSATSVTDERRLEGKLTGQLGAHHNLTLSYFDRAQTATNTQFTAVSYDLESLTDRSDPQTLKTAIYNGILTNNLMLEARYAAMKWGVGIGSGSKFTDPVRGTIVRNRADSNARFNSPTFCGVCDRETRSNDSWNAKLNYFLSGRGIGNHSIVGGVEDFSEHRFANNYQSGSNYRLFVNSVQRIGETLYPTLTPGPSGSAAYLVYTPIFALQGKESDLQTRSAFVNDRWDLNDNFSFSLGVRYDKNHAVDSSGNVVAKDSKFSPRLNVAYDPFGNGRHRFTASYGDYASRIVEGPGTAAASGGSPAYIYYAYQGPAINPAGTPTNQLVNTRQALETVFNWFLKTCNAQGKCGPENLSLLRSGSGHSVPGYDTVISSDLASPYVREMTVGYGLQIASNAVARIDLVARDWHDFYGFRVDRGSYSQRVDPLGIPHDVAVVENTNDIERTYRGVQFQTNWRPGPFTFGLNYTWSKLRGNDEQESATSGTVGNAPGSISYPELRNYAQRLPIGYLSSDQRHRARAWAGYDLPLPRVIGALNVSVLHSYESGTPYSAVANITLAPYSAALRGDAPYVTFNNSQQYFFSKRGEFRYDDINSTDIALNYRLPIGRFEIFAQGDVINVFDNDTVRIVNTTVTTANTNSNFTPFNPFTTTQLIECPQFTDGKATPAATCKAMGAHWQKGASFGLPTSAVASTPANAFTSNFQTARTYRFSAGFRF
ncbi:MAG: TonB-dependent receptor [Acidobacteriota bacterium]|nr:TonB-dependent receptor [Acidobacteriota bacterium]